MLKILEILHYKQSIISLGLILSLFYYKAHSQQLPYDSLFIKIEPITKINTKEFSEYAPFTYKNELYFISDRDDNLLIINRDKESKNVFSGLYKSTLKDSVSPSKPDKILNLFDSKFYVGPFCETNLGYYYTTTSTAQKQKKEAMGLQINFKSKDSIAKKSSIEKITFGMDESVSFAHPTLMGDSILFFASDLKEGQGKIDLYYSMKRNNVWQRPINCGSKINSKYNESFPYIINSRLYFASDRPNGFCGLVIYSIDWFTNETKLTLLPYPINSKADDFGVMINAKFDAGYFSSNRKGSDDIYYFRNLFPEFKDSREMKNNFYCYTFYEEMGNDNKDTVGLEYEWSFGNNIKKRGLEVKHCFEKDGKYLIKLNVVEKSSGEVFYNQLQYVLDLHAEKQLFIYSPDSMKTGQELEFDPSYSNIENFKMIDYYWDFGDNNHSVQKKPKHIYNNNGEYIVKLGVKGILNNIKTEMSCFKKIIINNKITQPIYIYNVPK